ncbi:MAG: aminotransferase class V-fold PLP-dependent enzyme [Selenomonadaceae bacterium]|nr:aminotransferase class V-fold PLP-dependent enzyme [Selenomonadaceae bacterium]
MKIYADNAATTKMSRNAIEAMLPYMKEIYGNPSSLYEIGQRAKEELEAARSRAAAALNCEPDEIYFTWMVCLLIRFTVLFWLRKL